MDDYNSICTIKKMNDLDKFFNYFFGVTKNYLRRPRNIDKKQRIYYIDLNAGDGFYSCKNGCYNGYGSPLKALQCIKERGIKNKMMCIFVEKNKDKYFKLAENINKYFPDFIRKIDYIILNWDNYKEFTNKFIEKHKNEPLWGLVYADPPGTGVAPSGSMEWFILKRFARYFQKVDLLINAQLLSLNRPNGVEQIKPNGMKMFRHKLRFNIRAWIFNISRFKKRILIRDKIGKVGFSLVYFTNYDKARLSKDMHDISTKDKINEYFPEKKECEKCKQISLKL